MTHPELPSSNLCVTLSRTRLSLTLPPWPESRCSTWRDRAVALAAGGSSRRDVFQGGDHEVAEDGRRDVSTGLVVAKATRIVIADEHPGNEVGVPPTNQASRKSLLVPVFPAIGLPTARTAVPVPCSTTLALASSKQFGRRNADRQPAPECPGSAEPAGVPKLRWCTQGRSADLRERSSCHRGPGCGRSRSG